MRTFALAIVAGLAAAQRNYGTTGHYGNQYGHGGRDDHDHDDHIYGYDSIPVQKILKPGEAGEARQQTILPLLETEVDNANQARLDYLQRVFDRKIQRLSEIHMNNIREIEAPFEYQLELLEKEEDDITVALTEAITDSNNAYTDMLNRLDRLFDDKMEALLDEVNKIADAIERAVVDKKNPCDVLRALRLDLTQYITCTPDNSTPPAFDDTDPLIFREYEGLFDDFHYDIGHGKGSGEGNVDAAPVRDGRRDNAPQRGPVGDWERDTGASTRSWEGNLYNM